MLIAQGLTDDALIQKLIALFVLDYEPCHRAHLHVVPPSPPMGARERALLSTCTTACCWPRCGAMPLFASFTAIKPAYAGRTTLPPTRHIRRALAVAVFGSWCALLSRSACLP